MIKMATGRSRSIAENNASYIKYNGVQTDSILLMDKGIAINRTDKFRNQRVVLTIHVPVGKRIKVDKSVSWFNNVHIGSDWNNDDWYYDSDDDAHDWKSGIEYTMKADGRLYNPKGEPSSRSGRTKVITNGDGIEVIIDDNNDNYRYNNNDPMSRLDSIQLKMEKEKEKIKDSLEKAKQKIEQQLEKISDNIEPTPVSYQMPVFNPMMSID